MNPKNRLLNGLFCVLLCACQQEQEMQNIESVELSERVNTQEQVSVEIHTPPAHYPEGQLPRSVVPKHYKLALRVDLSQQTFSGIVNIDVELSKPHSEVWLHGLDLNVETARLSSGGSVIPLQYEQVDEYGVVRLSSKQNLPAGEGTLSISYSAPFSRSLDGLYRVDAGGESYAFTQFEASAARLAMPSFDDPGFKTPFDISIEVKESDTAITNGPQLSSEKVNNGWKKITFATTKPLPTYLVAFIVGPLDVVKWTDLSENSIRKRPVPLSGIAVAGKGDQLDYALKNTGAILSVLEQYFGTQYPYAKLDIIAVPDFASGAMENAGAITYREPLLLLDEHSTAEEKYYYSLVHAHELAHQWFGNLVTPVWWDDIWLNEAFATWMASVSLDTLEPNAGHRRALTRSALKAMNVDSQSSARQIRQPIKSNHDIASAFDSITYSKGGGVLAMFERYLGAERFQTGIRDYLSKHAWGNATADDFIAAIAAAAGSEQAATIERSFKSFLNQPGVPLLATTLLCDADGVSVNIDQSRYIPLGINGDAKRDWILPICIRYGSASKVQSQCALVSKPQQKIRLATPSCPDWLMPNADGVGYFRFSLEDQQWQQLLDKTDVLNTSEMLVLVDSFLAAYKAGKLGVDSLMTQLPKLIIHPDPEVALIVLNDLGEIYTEIADSATQKVLRREVLPILRARLNQLGMDSLDDRNAEKLQATLVKLLAFTFQDSDLRSELSVLGQSYTGNTKLAATKTNADFNQALITIAVGVAVQEEGKDYFHFVQELALGSEDSQYRKRLLRALTHTHDLELGQQVRELSISKRVRNNEMMTVLYRQFNHPERRNNAWEWLEKNHQAIVDRLPKQQKGKISIFAKIYCDVSKIKSAEDFLGPKVDALAGGPRGLASAKESINQCVARKNHYQGLMRQWAESR